MPARLFQNEIQFRLKSFYLLTNSNVFTIIPVFENINIIHRAVEIASLNTTGKQGYISSYDATFHGLALELGCQFLTADEKHYNKTKEILGSVLLLSDLE